MQKFDLDTPLLQLTGKKSGTSCWTARNAVEGVQIFGGIGSGKTSGSGRALALKYLNAGFGGLVLSVKPDEKELWEGYCKVTKRTSDLLIVEPGRQNFFNFLDYECSNAQSGMTENIVQVLKTAIQAGEQKGSGRTDDAFWENALDMLIFNIVDLCKLAYGSISIQTMYDIVQALPKDETSPQQPAPDKVNAYKQAYNAAHQKVNEQINKWQKSISTEYLLEIETDGTYESKLVNAIPDAKLFQTVVNFFDDHYKTLSDKTRSIIDFSFSGFLFRLLREPVFSLFCNNASTFTPEDCFNGKIILINLPVKIYDKIGRDCQIMFKYIWQRAMERRNLRQSERPVFLWADEAQNFLHEHDADYQATARSSRIATVYISQNLPNYLSNMGGGKYESRVKSFLGTLNTKIFHANADTETNRYASDLIGDGLYKETSRTTTTSGQFSTSKSESIRFDKLVRPESFAQLLTGGPMNNYKTECYMHLQGAPLPNDQNHIKVSFNQEQNN